MFRDAASDLRAVGEGWARAADLLEQQADALTAGLPSLEGAWDSPAGYAYVADVRALVARMRATIEVVRRNYADLVAAADADDLDDVYATLAARLAESAVLLSDAAAPSVTLSMAPAGAPTDDAVSAPADGEVDAGLAGIVGWMPLPARRSYGGRGERVPAAPRIESASPVPPEGPEPASVAPRPAGADETRLDVRGHRVRIDWGGRATS
jgi:hypothetical protein